MSRITGRIWNFMRKSLRIPSKEDHFIGRDHLGNVYYEKLADTERNRRARRWVEAEDGNTDRIPDIPVEWESWLRRRRKEPPTQEMIDNNYVSMLRTQHRAKELEMKDRIEKEELIGEGENKSFTESVKGSSEKKPFPVYEEFEIKSGRKLDR